MQNDNDKLREMFGADARAGADTGSRRQKAVRPPENKKPAAPKREAKPVKAPYNEDDEITERDYQPIRSRRDGKIGCLGGLMYFVFVVSLSVILACLGWMAATDVLALNKAEETATITLPKEIFTEKEVEVTADDGSKSMENITIADIDYVSQLLKDSGIIRYKFLFKLYCGISHADRKLDPGTYELKTVFDYRALVKKMQTGSGAMVVTTLTFPEGYTLQQIFEKLEDNGVCSVEELKEAAANYTYNYAFLSGLAAGSDTRLEGYLFPDTYDFYQGMQASSAINKFLNNFNNRVTAEMYSWAADRGISFHNAVIIASMIESEAANDDERAVIASVIYNRLAAGMQLGIDATVMYALGEHKEVLTSEDLQVDSPYNTYKVIGLPAGPISNPGLASIKAALQPADTGYYYYALDTATGTHRFFTNKADFDAFVSTQNYG